MACRSRPQETAIFTGAGHGLSPRRRLRHKCNNGSTKQTSTSRKSRRRTWRKKLNKTDTKASGFYTGGFGLGHKGYCLPRYHCKLLIWSVGVTVVVIMYAGVKGSEPLAGTMGIGTPVPSPRLPAKPFV